MKVERFFEYARFDSDTGCLIGDYAIETFEDKYWLYVLIDVLFYVLCIILVGVPILLGAFVNAYLSLITLGSAVACLTIYALVDTFKNSLFDDRNKVALDEAKMKYDRITGEQLELMYAWEKTHTLEILCKKAGIRDAVAAAELIRYIKENVL